MRALIATALLACLPAGAVPAAEGSAGAALYGRYCATCHGAAGQGDGPTATYLNLVPADLSALAAGAGGTFPVARVVRRIDGRDAMLLHGSPMPFYGAFFEGARRVSIDTADGPLEVALPVLEIVTYLETLQR